MLNEMTVDLIPDSDILSVIPLRRILNPAIPEGTLRDRLTEMVLSQGYKCAGAYSRGQLVGICGMWILTKVYVGRHLEPDNVIILEANRSSGLGRRLVAWVHDYARSKGCVATELNCYLGKGKAQDFCEREGYRKIAVHYQKLLDP